MFNGRNAIITGGSSGIGKCLAARLHKKGANIALVARNMKKLEEARGELLAGGAGKGKIEVFSCDATDYQLTIDCVARIVEKMGPPDFLFNFAGVLSADYFENLSVEDFRHVMDTNFFGTLHFIKAALPHFKEKKGGHIVNMSSLSGVYGVFGYSSYCSSKFAITGLSECLRIELKPQGIKVHVVEPPEVDTPLLDAVKDTRPAETIKLAHSAGVLKPEETVDAVISGVEAGHFVIVPGRMPGMFAVANRVLPSVVRFFSDSIVKSSYKGPGGGK